MTAPAKLLVDRPAPGVARLRINRPDKRNAIDYDVRQLLIEALSGLLADGETRALVFGGIGGHFSAGGDVPSMVGLDDEQARARLRHIAGLCELVGNAGIPVVTAMEGISAGACIGLALLGDHIVVGDSTKILFPFMKLGLVPDWGTLLTLPCRVGLPAARRLILSGQFVSGAEAKLVGMADELVADPDVMPTAILRATDMAALPQAAFARMKRRLNRPSESLDEEMRREEDDQAALLCAEDFVEGYAAFSEKRSPDFNRKRSGA
jgi:2-(1,2-epoxy-1,2-dihydrophenyl)acetyl-CoA isomerase